MKKWVLINILFFSFLSISAQKNEDFILDDGNQKFMDKSEKHIFAELGVGTSVMYNSQKNYAFSTYLHPQISYQMTPRFQVSMGLMAVRSSFNNTSFYNYEGIVKNVDYNGLSAYYTLQGAYLITERLKVYGGIMLGRQSYELFKDNTCFKNQPKAYQLGLKYKLGENTSLQIEFQYREGVPEDLFYNQQNPYSLDHFSRQAIFFE